MLTDHEPFTSSDHRGTTGGNAKRSRVECWLSNKEQLWLENLARLEGLSMSATLRKCLYAYISWLKESSR